MDNKILVSLILGIFLISFVSADLGTFAQGTSVDLKGNINANYAKINVYFPNSSIAVQDANMTQINGDIWSYTFTSTTTEGGYSYDYCNELGTSCKENTFTIAYSSNTLDVGQAILYSSLFIVLILLSIATLFGIGKLPDSNTRDEEGRLLQVSYLKYLRSSLWLFEWALIIAILFISSNLAFAYLGEQLFAQTLFVLFRISLGLTPVILIVWVLWFYNKFFEDKEFKRLLNRGMFPQGNLP